MAHSLQWFKDRIGKRIFRNANDCGCNSCKDVYKNGIIVSDEFHAEYLAIIDNDYEACGVKLNFRDNE